MHRSRRTVRHSSRDRAQRLARPQAGGHVTREVQPRGGGGVSAAQVGEVQTGAGGGGGGVRRYGDGARRCWSGLQEVPDAALRGD